jgi:RNA polymerase sigma factor (TIGR02999 family)
MSEVTHLLTAAGQGEAGATDKLLAVVYEEMRRLAGQQMAREPSTQTLQPTALVHDAWLRLVGENPPHFANRAHFFGAAAEAMRRILIEKARRRHAVRHGGGLRRVELLESEIAAEANDEELLAVHEALDAFAERDAQKAELVKLRYFVGLTLEEAAEVLGIAVPTAKRWWTYARAWLFREITRQ